MDFNMKRSIEKVLFEWKSDPSRKPILLKGARQVGKSYLIQTFGKTFRRFVEINFDFQKDLSLIFKPDLDPVRINRDISIATGKRIIPGETLLFLDEIQECPDAIRALRYFFEKMPELHVIAAGSLLEFALQEIGLPVGRIQPLHLYPVAFVEFLKAKDEELLLEALIEHDTDKEMPEFHHQKLIRLYGEYMAIGGMPEAVEKWLESSDIKRCQRIHRTLVETYRQDFNKYAVRYQKKYVETVYSAVARMSGRKFKYTSVNPTYRSRELRPALDLLTKAGIVHKITHSSSSGSPLAAEMNPLFFKVIHSDVALMQAMLNFESGRWILSPENAAQGFGAMVEAFVGQELLAYRSPYQNSELYYWAREKRGSSAEIDYVEERQGNVIPIEVKAGKSSHLTSLRLFLNEKRATQFGLFFSQKNFAVQGKIRRFPLYAVCKLSDQAVL